MRTESRTYQETHPWIRFGFNLQSSSPLMWLDLGEAASKIGHLAKVPLQPTTAVALQKLYLAKGAAATTAIEGNSLSEAEVLAAVQGTLKVPPSKQYLQQEVSNVLRVFNEIAEQIEQDRLPPISPELICAYDKKVLLELPLEEGVVAGTYRTHSVVVGPYRGAPAVDCEYLMARLCDWLASDDFAPREGYEIPFAIIKAIVAHLYLAWIHPFGDGNGRTARLVEFHILMSACVPAPAAHLLSNHYNQTRSEYYRQLDYASKSGGDIVPFVEYAVRGLRDGLRSQLEYVWDQNWHVAWQNYVHALFQSGSGDTNRRRRTLALVLGAKTDWVEISSIPQLSIELASAYAGKGPKTVQRDVNSLWKLGLTQKERKRVRAKREIIMGFLPLQKKKTPAILVPSVEPSTGQLQLSLQSVIDAERSANPPAPSHP